MEDNSFYVTSMAGILGEIQVLRREQTAAFALLTDAIAKLADKLDGRSSAEKERVTSTTDKDAALNNLEQLNEKSQEAQETYDSFNPEDVYNTLIDPFPRKHQELIDYGMEECRQYDDDDDEVSNLRDVFEEDFLYWAEEHFQSLPTSVISTIRDLLINKNVHIDKRLGLRISAELAHYLEKSDRKYQRIS